MLPDLMKPTVRQQKIVHLTLRLQFALEPMLVSLDELACRRTAPNRIDDNARWDMMTVRYGVQYGGLAAAI